MVLIFLSIPIIPLSLLFIIGSSIAIIFTLRNGIEDQNAELIHDKHYIEFLTSAIVTASLGVLIVIGFVLAISLKNNYIFFISIFLIVCFAVSSSMCSALTYLYNIPEIEKGFYISKICLISGTAGFLWGFATWTSYKHYCEKIDFFYTPIAVIYTGLYILSIASLIYLKDFENWVSNWDEYPPGSHVFPDQTDFNGYNFFACWILSWVCLVLSGIVIHFGKFKKNILNVLLLAFSILLVIFAIRQSEGDLTTIGYDGCKLGVYILGWILFGLTCVLFLYTCRCALGHIKRCCCHEAGETLSDDKERGEPEEKIVVGVVFVVQIITRVTKIQISTSTVTQKTINNADDRR